MGDSFGTLIGACDDHSIMHESPLQFGKVTLDFSYTVDFTSTRTYTYLGSPKVTTHTITRSGSGSKVFTRIPFERSMQVEEVAPGEDEFFLLTGECCAWCRSLFLTSAPEWGGVGGRSLSGFFELPVAGTKATHIESTGEDPTDATTSDNFTVGVALWPIQSTPCKKSPEPTTGEACSISVSELPLMENHGFDSGTQSATRAVESNVTARYDTGSLAFPFKTYAVLLSALQPCDASQEYTFEGSASETSTNDLSGGVGPADAVVYSQSLAMSFSLVLEPA